MVMSNTDGIYELTVIGGGIGGAASALRAAQYNIKTAWILGDKKTARRSRSQWVMNIDNMIGVHPGIVLSKLRQQWQDRPELIGALNELPHLHINNKDIIDNVHDRLNEMPGFVTEISAAATGAMYTEDGRFEIKTEDAEHPVINSRNVIIATGIMDRQPNIAKIRGDKVVDMPKWIYPFANRESVLYCIRCEGHLTRKKKAAIIGASEVTAQVGLMLAERYGSTCCILANGEPVTIESDTRRLLNYNGIEVFEERIVDILQVEGSARGKLHGFELEGARKINVAFALVSMGMYKIYNDLARELGAELLNSDQPEELRYVKIDSKGETSVKNLFTVGDMALRPDEPVMKQIYTAQEYAVRAVDTIDRRRRQRMRKDILVH